MATLKVTVPEDSQNILSVVTLSAPLERVFQAYADEKLFSQSWGRGNPMEVYRFDCRDGGNWHVAERSEDGKEYVFMGSFHEVALNERIVQTFEYLGMPERGHVMLQKAEFAATGASTTEIRTISTAQSREARDGMVASGMEGGWRYPWTSRSVVAGIIMEKIIEMRFEQGFATAQDQLEVLLART
jgi:uncharacterized protein YndB with AHSA1/START domain